MSSIPNLAEILGKISDGICVFDHEREVSFMNERAAQILTDSDPEFRNKIAGSARSHTAIRFEHFHESLNLWFDHQTYPNADAGLTLISRDITSRRRVEEALRASEDRFRRLTESNIIGVIMVESGFITEANDVFLKMVGRTRTDLVTKQLRWRQMTPPEHDSSDIKARAELELTGGFSPYEKEFFRKDGSRVPILIGGVSTAAKAGVHETLCLALDLSERKRGEERVRSIVECGKILASSLEYEKSFPELAEFIAANLADSCEIFVYERDRLVRSAAAHAPPARTDLELEADVARILRTGQAEVLVAPLSRIIVPILARNEVAGVLVVRSNRPGAFDSEDLHLFDVFARRAGLALENARLYHETQQANRLKDEFVAIVSHELRTPLTPILGGVYMMRSEPHDEKVFTRALDLIERNAQTQVKIVDDLLDVSRALTGKMRLNMEPIDLSVVVKAAIETVRSASDAKNIRLDVGDMASALVSGDRDRLQQVVWNLLSNAVKFTPPGGHITIEVVPTGGHAEIRIKDTGIGIEAEFLPHLFEKFRQADTSRTRSHGGLGLGLAIVRHLVESHGGTVHAHSSGDKQGATFVVRLPLRSAGAAAKKH